MYMPLVDVYFCLSWVIPSSAITGSYDKCMFNLLRTLSSKWLDYFCIPSKRDLPVCTVVSPTLAVISIFSLSCPSVGITASVY